MISTLKRGILEMEEKIDRLKAFSDVLLSSVSADALPDAKSLYEVVSILYIDAKDLQEKYIGVCNTFHELETKKGELVELHPEEVMEMVKQTENGNKSIKDAIYDAFLLGEVIQAAAGGAADQGQGMNAGTGQAGMMG